MNTVLKAARVSLRFVTEPSDHSVSNHLPSPRRISGISCVGLTGPRRRGRPFGSVRLLGFAVHSQARHDIRPNRVYSRHGLIVHLRLLSTPPRGDAVTFGYGVPEHPGKDSRHADSMQLQAHEGRSSLPLCHGLVASRRTPKRSLDRRGQARSGPFFSTRRMKRSCCGRDPVVRTKIRPDTELKSLARLALTEDRGNERGF